MSKALIIDDEKPVRIALEKLGDWQKYDITEILMASNGKEGLEVMRLQEPEYIFLDICMPIMNGLEFLECAKEEYPNSQFIIVSGYDDFHYAQNALRFGATDYLLKPVDRQSINNALEHAAKKLAVALEEQMQAQSAESASPTETNSSDKYTTEQIVEMIHNYIDEHFYENIKITMFSERFFFSKEYISRAFKAKYQYGIYEYVLKVRMEKACKLLQDESIKIQDVGESVGFQDNNYFSKAFKNYYNISPSEYRRDYLTTNKE